MGVAPSSQGRGGDDDDDDDDDEEEEEAEEEAETKLCKEKVLEQEPEILPCHAPATPISAASTPRVLGPSIRVWDPCNVLLPPPPPSPPEFGASDAGEPEAEVFLISHGESGASLRPDLVGGRWPGAGLTGNGERQSRALAVFLNSQGVRFSAVYSSPLDRARATATFVCRVLFTFSESFKSFLLTELHWNWRSQVQIPETASLHAEEVDFADEQIQSSDALVEMSQGQWEGSHRSDIYTAEIISLIDRTQPDFSAPSGESLRQVQFRMIEFLNKTILRLPERMIAGETSLHRNEAKGFSRDSSASSVQDRDGTHWDMLYRHQPGIQRKKSGKSRLQFVTTGDNKVEDEFSPREANHEHLLHEVTTSSPTTSIGIFTHSTPIKCLVTGLLNCSPALSHRICIDDSSVTVLQHSLRTGWQIKRLNDTSHLRLL